jgi:hypothetical protein
MPFTPFHMGPGLAIKAVFGRHVSLMLFGFSQVAIDVEPLVRIVRGDVVVHGFTHTYLGATVVALAALVIGRPVCQAILNAWTPPSSDFLQWLLGPRLIAWPAAIGGAFVGTYSHVALDSLMHADMRPLAPWSNSNGLLQLVSLGALHLACVLSGLAGVLLMLALFARRRTPGAARAG